MISQISIKYAIKYHSELRQYEEPIAKAGEPNRNEQEEIAKKLLFMHQGLKSSFCS